MNNNEDDSFQIVLNDGRIVSVGGLGGRASGQHGPVPDGRARGRQIAGTVCPQRASEEQPASEYPRPGQTSSLGLNCYHG